MAFDAGNLYVTSNNNQIGRAVCKSSFISKFDQLGAHTYFRAGLNSPRGISIDDKGIVYVATMSVTGVKPTASNGSRPPARRSRSPRIVGDLNAFGLSSDVGSRQMARFIWRIRAAICSGGIRVNACPLCRACRRFQRIRQDALSNSTLTRRDGDALVVRRPEAASRNPNAPGPQMEISIRWPGPPDRSPRCGRSCVDLYLWTEWIDANRRPGRQGDTG